MLICIRPGGDKFEPSQRTHDRAFTRSNPLFTTTRTNATWAHVSSPASWA